MQHHQRTPEADSISPRAHTAHNQRVGRPYQRRGPSESIRASRVGETMAVSTVVLGGFVALSVMTMLAPPAQAVIDCSVACVGADVMCDPYSPFCYCPGSFAQVYWSVGGQVHYACIA